MNVELYSKPNCSLCDEARATLLEARKKIPFELLEVDIEKDPALKARYQHEVPVVFVDGKAWFKLKVEREALEKRLERARSFSMGTLDPQKTLSRTAPVSRATKLAFAVVVFASIAAVFVAKGYSRTVLDRQRALEGFELIKQDRPAPDFQLQGPDGKPVVLSAFKGRLLLLNFYATWCAPCREEVPSLNALAREVGEDRITVLAVDVQEDWDTVHRFYGALAPSFALALDASGEAAKAYEQRPNLMFPETFIVTPDGRVVAKVEGPRNWTDPTIVRHLRSLAGG